MTNAWDQVNATAGGTVGVTSAAALSGSLGLEIGVVEGAGQVHVKKDFPKAHPQISVEFEFDPNSAAMNDGSAHPILHAESASGNTFSLALVRQFGVYQLRLHAVDDSGQSLQSGIAFVADGPSSLRIDFRKATAPGVPDGSVDLWVDGAKIHTLAGLDNASKALHSLRLGAIWLLDPGTVGQFYFDEFRAW